MTALKRAAGVVLVALVIAAFGVWAINMLPEPRPATPAHAAGLTNAQREDAWFTIVDTPSRYFPSNPGVMPRVAAQPNNVYWW